MVDFVACGGYGLQSFVEGFAFALATTLTFLVLLYLLSTKETKTKHRKHVTKVTPNVTSRTRKG